MEYSICLFIFQNFNATVPQHCIHTYFHPDSQVKVAEALILISFVNTGTHYFSEYI